MHAVHRRKTGAMRELQHLVSRGHTRWVGGEVVPRKLEALALKFADRYAIDRSAQQRWRCKKRGLANASLVSWFDSENDRVLWWLLVTPGSGLVEDLEKLAETGNKRSRITLTGYELVKAPRRGKEAAWTWRMTKATEEAWRERVRTVFRHGTEDQCRQALYSLSRVPGFHGARSQAWELIQQTRADWKRSQPDEWPFGKVLIPWVGRYKSADTMDVRQFGEWARRRR